MELNDIRREIDAIDDELVQLFARRMDMIDAVARAKRESNRPIRDRSRERQILSRVTARAGDRYAPYARALYAHIFELSRSYQSAVWQRQSPLAGKIAGALAAGSRRHLPERAPVACQSTEGAYGRQACEKLFTHPDILYFDRFEDVFSAVEKGMCQYGILPIEDSAAGSVTQVYDLVEKFRFYIVGAHRPSGSRNSCARFICVSRSLEIDPRARRISLMLSPAREPGALNGVLSRLAVAGVDIVRLESRPLPGREAGYRFFLDMSASVADPDVVRLLGELEAECDGFALLGCYDEQ